MDNKTSATSGVLLFKNKQDVSIKLTVEPWCHVQLVPPGSTAEVLFEGPPSGQIEIQIKPGEIVVFGWVGSILSIGKD
jgi:hypothetical protein